jgi:hypothetical protein
MLLRRWPPATQLVADAHDTPRRLLSRVPGFGLARIDHTLPFQPSTTVRVVGPFTEKPTAMHRADVVHDTLRRYAARTAAGFGLATTDQSIPRHVSIKVRRNESPDQPTATHVVAPAQDTPMRTELVGSGLGAVVTDQLVPSHFSTSVRLVPSKTTEDPTATQLVAVAHETPFSCALERPGLGEVVSVQLVPCQVSTSVRTTPTPSV